MVRITPIKIAMEFGHLEVTKVINHLRTGMILQVGRAFFVLERWFVFNFLPENLCLEPFERKRLKGFLR